MGARYAVNMRREGRPNVDPQPANVGGVQPQGGQIGEQPGAPNARSLAQKLDAMLLKAAKMSAKSVDADSIKAATGKLILNKAERKALAVAAFKAKQTLKAVSNFTGRQIASAWTRPSHTPKSFSGKRRSSARKTSRKRMSRRPFSIAKSTPEIP